jgi:hypothetical protein
VLDSQALAEQGWAYVVAGHVHKPEKIERVGADTPLGTTTTLLSIGSPWRHDFGEADIAPGVWLLDTKTHELVDFGIEDRRFLTIDLETVEGDGENSIALPQAPEGHLQVIGPTVDPREAIVRVRVKVREENVARVSVENIRRNLTERGAHKVFVHLDVERSVRARTDVAEDSEPLAAVEAWAKATGIEAQPCDRLRALTETLLEETR